VKELPGGTRGMLDSNPAAAAAFISELDQRPG
jgi:hypothetical protein